MRVLIEVIGPFLMFKVLVNTTLKFHACWRSVAEQSSSVYLAASRQGSNGGDPVRGSKRSRAAKLRMPF